MAAEIFAVGIQSALAICSAILVVLALRYMMRPLLGSSAVYALWLIVPITAMAVFFPSDFVVQSGPGGITGSVSSVSNPDLQMGNTILPLTAPDTGWQVLKNVLVVIWFAGALFSFLWLLFRQYKYLRGLALQPWSSSVFQAGRADVGPAVIGFLRPKIVVPSDFQRKYNTQEQALILAHEEAHIRAGDMQMTFLAATIRCLVWFYPVAYRAYELFRVDQELACDERVMRDHGQHRRIYAETLLKSQLMTQMAPISCGWLPERMHPLKQRVARLAAPRLTSTRRAIGVIFVGTTVALSGLLSWNALASHVVYIEANPSKDPPPFANEADQMGGALVEALIDDHRATAEALIKAGANVNYHLRGDGTPLTAAVGIRDLHMMKKLIAAGADVNQAVPGEGSALILATREGYLNVVKFLVDFGADVNGYVRWDETPLIKAAETNNSEIARFLIAKGADVNLVVETGNSPPRAKYRSPLGQARKAGHHDMIRLLRDHGARKEYTPVKK